MINSRAFARLGASVCLIGGIGAAAPAQAGLFDFLFGAQPQPAYRYPAYAPDYRPLEMRVAPRRRFRPERGDRAERARNREDRKPRQLAKPIDPVKNPNWFLEDPTLRRGDIVVLKTGAFVFDGGRNPAMSDFSSIKETRRISPKERERIGKMVGKENNTTIVNEIVPLPIPAPTASVASASKEASLIKP